MEKLKCIFFLGFSDVSEDRTAAKLKEELDNTLDEYQCGEKLIAQTYDGAIVMLGELSLVYKHELEKVILMLFLFTSVAVL